MSPTFAVLVNHLHIFRERQGSCSPTKPTTSQWKRRFSSKGRVKSFRASKAQSALSQQVIQGGDDDDDDEASLPPRAWTFYPLWSCLWYVCYPPLFFKEINCNWHSPSLPGQCPPQTYLLELINSDVPLDEDGNPVDGFYHHVFQFHRINRDKTGHHEHAEVAFQIRNKGEVPLEIFSFTLSAPDIWEYEGDVPATIQPGEAQDYLLRFIIDFGERGIKEGNLTINSNDPAAPELQVELFGAYMEYPENQNGKY